MSKRLEQSVVIIGVTLPLLATIYAIYRLWNMWVTWNDIALMVGMYIFTAFGTTVGYHRMLTHRSFEAHPAVRAIFLALGSMAFQGRADVWASTHIQHHAETDTDSDPHSPIHGFFHAHMGWFTMRRMDAQFDKYGKWLLKDPMIQFFSNTFIFWTFLTLLIPFLIGGWTGLLWGGFVRIFLTNHVTWSVNSVCHTMGKRMFETSDLSKNNWLVGLLAMGEGWHNNHHAFPRSAFHGMRWWQFDSSSYVIMLLEKLGLAKNVWRVPEAAFQARLIKKSEPVVPDMVAGD